MSGKSIKRLFKYPKEHSFFIFGPRGVGKSFYLAGLKPKVAIDFLDEFNVLEYSNHPEKIENLVRPLQEGDLVVLDEIQKVPELLSKVHQIMENPNLPRVQFVLTGSSSRKLKQKGVDLLAGRALLKTMHPYMASELEDSFDLEKSLKWGLLPIVWASIDPGRTLKSYIALYLKEEVKQEGLVKDLAAFSRFLEAISFSHGEVLNLSNVSRDCQVKRSTVDGYLEVLEDLLLGYRLPPFKKKNRKNTISSDKFYLFDAGVFRSIRSTGPLDDAGLLEGACLEGLVMQHLKAWVAYRDRDDRLFFWRTEAGNEVDFVVYGEGVFLAIEVKLTQKLRKADLSGLRSFSQDYPEAELIFLYQGPRAQHEKIHCLPITDFLLSLSIDG